MCHVMSGVGDVLHTYATTANIDLYAFLVSLTCTGKSNARAIVMYFPHYPVQQASQNCNTTQYTCT